MKKLDGKTILKILEITVSALGIVGNVFATIKAAKISEDQMNELADKTAMKVVDRLLELSAPESEENK